MSIRLARPIVQCPSLSAPPTLERVLEAGVSLNLFSATIHALVCAVELEAEHANNGDHEGIRNHAGQNPGFVSGLISRPEHGGADDAANGTPSNKSGGCKSALPLAPNIVGLIGEKHGAVGIACDRCKEDTEVPDAARLDVAQEAESDHA